VPSANQLLEQAARTAWHHDPWVLLLAGVVIVVAGVANQFPQRRGRRWRWRPTS